MGQISWRLFFYLAAISGRSRLDTGGLNVAKSIADKAISQPASAISKGQFDSVLILLVVKDCIGKYLRNLTLFTDAGNISRQRKLTSFVGEESSATGKALPYPFWLSYWCCSKSHHELFLRSRGVCVFWPAASIPLAQWADSRLYTQRAHNLSSHSGLNHVSCRGETSALTTESLMIGSTPHFQNNRLITAQQCLCIATRPWWESMRISRSTISSCIGVRLMSHGRVNKHQT